MDSYYRGNQLQQQAKSQPDREVSVWAIVPCQIRCSVRTKLTCHHPVGALFAHPTKGYEPHQGGSPQRGLSGTDLVFADLGSANLSTAHLNTAQLYGANLTNANLWGANLTGADLRSADLTSADLREANLFLADLTGADWPHGREIPQFWTANGVIQLRRADT